MTFSRVWLTGFVRLLNRYAGTDELPDLLAWMENEAMCAADNDEELCAIYETAAMAKALKSIAERDDIRTPEMVRCINTATNSAFWVLDDINNWAFKMVKGPDGKWIMQGIQFEALKKKGAKV